MKRIIVCGSINIDEVYSVPHIVQPGETIASTKYAVHAGGKGANQSVALAKAGCEVFHLGKIGADGLWVVKEMEGAGVNSSFINLDAKGHTGKAIIQVSDDGCNSIVLSAGCNAEISECEWESWLNKVSVTEENMWCVFQNEVSNGNLALRMAKQKKMLIVLNPSPLQSDFTNAFDLKLVDVLVVNELELKGLNDLLNLNLLEKQEMDLKQWRIMGRALFQHLAQTLGCLVLTLGELGSLSIFHTVTAIEEFYVPIVAVQVVDSTGAGDTFLGYFIATLAEMEVSDARGHLVLNKEHVQRAAQRATVASSIACSRNGAMPSIPTFNEVDQ